jgi:uncharacterized membrane protein YjjP (DUF1212 family)
MEVKNNGREIYKDDFTEYLLCLALDVGEGMLKNGAEVGRVEDTIERICRAYGAVHVEVFTIISVINAAIRMPDGSYSSQLRRVRQTSNNLNTLERLNSISRRICNDTPSLDEFDGMLKELKKERPYHNLIYIAASAIAAGAFCLFFGGGVIDSIITFFIGLIISFILNYPSKRLNSMAKTVISAFCAVTIAGISQAILPTIDLDPVIIGAIMLLVPGVLFVTAMRDLLCGDLIAGTLKILQALVQTLMIGFGYMLSYALIGDTLIPNGSVQDKDLFLIQLITSFISSVAFSIIFKINKRHLVIAGVCGALTYIVYFAVLAATDSLFWASFICSAVLALYSEINARIRKAPSIVMFIPGIIPIVPGGYLYRCVRDYICELTGSAINELTNAGAIALGMAGGIVALTIVFGMVNDYISKRYRKNIKSEKERIAINK